MKLLCAPVTATATALALFAATPAFASTTLIDFDAVTSFASIADYYNGGADSAGAVGPSLGVSFSGDALGLANDFDTYFTHAPSPVGVMFAAGLDATMNVAAGFTDAISLFYSSDSLVLRGIEVWGGLNGTGTLLASFNLAANAQAGCSDSAFCHFDQISSTFQGTAHSVTFGNSAGFAAIDNVSITAVPEPSSVALMLAGFAVVGSLARRRLNRG